MADPALRRGLAGPSDSRDGPLHLLASGLHGRPIPRSAQRIHVRCRRPLVLGERSGRRGNARGGAVDSEGAARGRRSARLWLDRSPLVRDLPPGASSIAAPAGQPGREHHPEHDDRLRDRRQRVSAGGNPPVREPDSPDRRRPSVRDLRLRDGGLLRHLVPAHDAVPLPRAPTASSSLAAPSGMLWEATLTRGFRARPLSISEVCGRSAPLTCRKRPSSQHQLRRRTISSPQPNAPRTGRASRSFTTAKSRLRRARPGHRAA